MKLYEQAGGNASAMKEYDVLKRQSEGISILLTVLLSLIVLLTVLGNSVVILAFIVDKRLRNRSNFFLLNLSICDFLVGKIVSCISRADLVIDIANILGFKFRLVIFVVNDISYYVTKITKGTRVTKYAIHIQCICNILLFLILLGAISISMYIPYKFMGKWMLGKFLCKLWITVDYTATTASAYNIVLISYDRFLSVNKAVLHRSLQKKHSQTLLNLALVWIFSFIIYGPAVLLWENITGTNDLPEDSCLAGFLETWYFMLGASTLDFIFPLLSISFFNLRIYLEIIKRSIRRQNCSRSRSSKENAKDKTPFTITTNSVPSSIQTNEKGDNNSVPCMDLKITSNSPQTPESYNTHNNSNKHSQDKKAAKSLAILVSVFILCWTPYSFTVCIRAVCDGHCADYFYIETTVWFLWTNSAINPILYPVCHKSFRKAFKLLLERFMKFFLQF